jgi:flavin-binding protein dodecin
LTALAPRVDDLGSLACGSQDPTFGAEGTGAIATGGQMSDHVPGAVVRISEIVGSSPNSFSDAVRNAVQFASQTVRNIRGVEVISSNADVDENGNISLYKVNCKIAFVVERQ